MRVVVVLCLVSALSGCHTFRTTAVDRCENDAIVVNPEKPMDGIPVSLRVPTHLQLQIVETTYWQKTIDRKTDEPTLKPLRTSRPTRTVLHKVCETEKIFLVDPVRPAAGIQNYGFEFQSNGADDKSKAAAGKGYIKDVKYKVDDQTITQSASLLANSLNLIQALQKSANDSKPNTSDLISTDRVVAYGRFDINAPCFDAEVEQFLDTYLNSAPCGQCPVVVKGDFCTYCDKSANPVPGLVPAE